MRHHIDRDKKKTISILKIFLTTFFTVVFSGIFVLGIVKVIRGSAESESVEMLTYWEEVPDAGHAGTVENDEGDETFEEPEICEEDREYTHSVETGKKDTVTIGFAGDILFDDNYAVGDAFKRQGDSAKGVLGDKLLSVMNKVDIMLINNEFPYSLRGEPSPNKEFTFRARPETAKILNEMGVDMVSLANNHAFDYGEQALLDSFDALNGVGVAYGGAGRNIEEASHPIYYVTDNGMKIAFICATQIERLGNPDTKEATANSAGVFRCLDDSLLIEKIKEAKEKNAFVVTFIHWGTESTNELDFYQTDQAKEIADAGADLIIGSHPHVLQKIDYVNGVPVVYSLGNFIFNSKTLDTGMVIAKIRNDGSFKLQFVPGIQEGCTVHEAQGEERSRIMRNICEMSPGIEMDEKGYISPK